jgi:hypothetical protein
MQNLVPDYDGSIEKHWAVLLLGGSGRVTPEKHLGPGSTPGEYQLPGLFDPHEG